MFPAASTANGLWVPYTSVGLVATVYPEAQASACFHFFEIQSGSLVLSIIPLRTQVVLPHHLQGFFLGCGCSIGPSSTFMPGTPHCLQAKSMIRASSHTAGDHSGAFTRPITGAKPVGRASVGFYGVAKAFWASFQVFFRWIRRDSGVDLFIGPFFAAHYSASSPSGLNSPVFR